MANDTEMIALIKGAAQEGQFDKMSLEEMEKIYRHGNALLETAPDDRDLLDAVNMFLSAINRRGNTAQFNPQAYEPQTADHQKTFVMATRWKRFVGSIVDGCLMLAFVFPVMYFLGLFPMSRHLPVMTTGQLAIIFLTSYTAFFALNGYLLYHRGQTVGKYVMKMKIVDLDGNLPAFGKMITFRYVIFWLAGLIPFVGRFVSLADALFIFGGQRRCLHDYAAGTMVLDIAEN